MAEVVCRPCLAPDQAPAAVDPEGSEERVKMSDFAC